LRCLSCSLKLLLGRIIRLQHKGTAPHKERMIMDKKQELIDYIMNMPPEQIDKVVKRLDLLKQAVGMTDSEATYISHFSRLMFGHNP